MINYVTYDQSGVLTGAYAQDVHSSHVSNYIEVTEQQRRNWVLYEANIGRDGLMLEPAPAFNLSLKRAEKNTQINLWRATANSSTFTHAGKTIACDPLSRSDIDAVAGSIGLTGSYPTSFPMQWKATDNTYLQLADVDAFKAFYASMVAQGTANFIRSEQLKAELAAASTPNEIDAITW